MVCTTAATAARSNRRATPAMDRCGQAFGFRPDQRSFRRKSITQGGLGMRHHLKRLLAAAALLASCALPSLAQDKVTLVMWHNHPEWKERVEAILRKFEAANPNITIDLEEISGPDYTPRMN